MTFSASLKEQLRLRGVALAAVLIVCAGIANGFLAAPVGTAIAAARPDDSLLRRVAALDSWRNNRADAKAFGLISLYNMSAYSPFKYGPRDSVWYIGTYSASCLVTIGYSNDYSELGIRVAPKLSVQVFNRYGGSTYLDANDEVGYKGVRTFVRKSALHCD